MKMDQALHSQLQLTRMALQARLSLKQLHRTSQALQQLLQTLHTMMRMVLRAELQR